jgi:hypothetical protein
MPPLLQIGRLRGAVMPTDRSTSAGSISVAGDLVLPSGRVVVWTLTCRTKPSYSSRAKGLWQSSSKRAIQRRRASFGPSFLTSSGPPHISHDGLLREVCSPAPTILCQRERTGPLIGSFRLISHDETDRVKAAISIAMHFVAPRQSSGQIILGSCTAGNAEQIAATIARDCEAPVQISREATLSRQPL